MYLPFMTKRTDIHRPAVIVPADYRYVFSYNGATTDGGYPVPSYGITCEVDGRTWEYDDQGRKTKCINGTHREHGECCVVGILQSGKTMVGNACKCTICGAAFVYGDVWQHKTTGEYIHLGHTCSDKYAMFADRSKYDMAFAHMKAINAREIAKELNKQEREAFLAANPGLEEVLKGEHRIIKSIAESFKTFRKLTEKQIALVFKIQADLLKPPAEKEKTVNAPVSDKRQTFTGEVVSTKIQEGDYGTSYKMAVKVTTPEGVWIAWGTIPANILEDVPAGKLGRVANLRGATVEVTAKLQLAQKPEMAYTNRPNGKLVALTPEVQTIKDELTAMGMVS